MHPTPSTSASPAPFGRFRCATRHSDRPSPSKRRRLTTPASQSESTTDPQLDTERRASSSRVLSVWSALEDKYTRRLDEDDIVDLRSGGLLRDRGVLSSTAGTWPIGCFADPKDPQRHGNTAAEEEDDEDGGDEIGGWGSDSELDHQFNPVHVPPVHELDPEDAEDLRAFLAAEEVRKALHGVDDLSEAEEALDERSRNLDTEYDANVDTEESIVEIDATSAPPLPPTDSDDELAGFDETVGEGALLWEVGTELSNCSEPLCAEGPAVPKSLPPLPHRNNTPAQLRTPPLSRSSVKPPNKPDFTRTSPPPPNRPPLNLPPPKPRKRPTSTKNEASRQRLTEELKPQSHSNKETERAASLSPTKNLVPEIILPVRRVSDLVKQDEDTRLDHHRTPARGHQTPARLTRSVSISPSLHLSLPLNHVLPRSSSRGHDPDDQTVAVHKHISKPRKASGHASEQEKTPSTSPRRTTKRKRILSEEIDADMNAAINEDRLALRTRGRRQSDSSKPVESSSPPLLRRRRHSTSIPRQGPKASSSIDTSISSSPKHGSPLRSSSYHRSSTPSLPSRDFWPPYPRAPHTPAPTFPIPFPAHPSHTRETSIPPDAHVYIAQAMQSLSYLAFGPPAQPTASPSRPPLHIPSPPPHSSPSWSYPPSYYPPHARSHTPGPTPPWLYPPYPFYYPPTTHPHRDPSAPVPSSATPYRPPSSGGEPPPSPLELSSSPLSGRGKGKRVTFPQDVIQSESDWSGTETDVAVVDTGRERGKWRDLSPRASGRSRRD